MTTEVSTTDKTADKTNSRPNTTTSTPVKTPEKKPIKGTSFDDALKGAGIDNSIARHKNTIIAVAVVLVLGVFGYGIFSYLYESKRDTNAKIVFEFSKGDYQKFKDGKLTPLEMLKSYDNIKNTVGDFSGFTPLSIALSDIFYEQKKYDEALKILNGLSHSGNPYLHFFINTRRAAIYEDQKKFQDAKEQLESLVKASNKLMEDKIYLDLGRIWLALGNPIEARKHFEYLTSASASFGPEFVKLARLYLEDIREEQ